MAMEPPAHFGQRRPGITGEASERLTSRTMLLPNSEQGSATDRDQMTPLDDFLGNASLDELPTMCNILRREVWFVGPRLLPRQYLYHCTPEQTHRHGVDRELTGRNQLSGCNPNSWGDKYEHDVQYGHALSLAIGVKTIVRTAVQVPIHDSIPVESRSHHVRVHSGAGSDVLLRLIICWADGFERETVGIVRKSKNVTPIWRLLGNNDDAHFNAYLDCLEALDDDHVGSQVDAALGTGKLVVLAGSPVPGKRVVGGLAGRRHRYLRHAHPMVVPRSELQHGAGRVVLGGVGVGTNIRLHSHIHLDVRAVIGHDVELEAFASVSPSAMVSGETCVWAGTLVNAVSVILHSSRVGLPTPWTLALASSKT